MYSERERERGFWDEGERLTFSQFWRSFKARMINGPGRAEKKRARALHGIGLGPIGGAILRGTF